MSYLMHCIVKPAKRAGVSSVRLKWRSIAGTVVLTSPTAPGGSINPNEWVVYFPRYTRLGGLLRNNNELERLFIGRELQKQGFVPLAATLSFIGC